MACVRGAAVSATYEIDGDDQQEQQWWSWGWSTTAADSTKALAATGSIAAAAAGGVRLREYAPDAGLSDEYGGEWRIGFSGSSGDGCIEGAVLLAFCLGRNPLRSKTTAQTVCPM